MGKTGSKPLPSLPTTTGAQWADKRFNFENLVFEGGGAKGIAYIGVCKVLEDAKILPQIKRFAGTSAGAITAALLAIGLTPQEMLEELSAQNLLDVVLDARCKPLSWMPGMKKLIQLIDVIARKGACPGKKFMAWFGEILERHLKKRGLPLDKDVTFEQIYHILGTELCIVAYNVNYDVETYFHVKTTPVLRVREAVRMSMSIPVAFQPYRLEKLFTYVDGGIAANFPLYAFDGWYLSMEKSSSFHRRFQTMGQTEPDVINQLFDPNYRTVRFRSPDPESDDFFKTLGVLIFSKNNREAHQYLFEKRLQILSETQPDFPNQRPNTIKARKYTTELQQQADLTKTGKESLQNQMEMMTTIIRLIFDEEDAEEGTSDIAPAGIARTDGASESEAGPKVSADEARRLFHETLTDTDVKRLQVTSKEDAFKMLLLDDKGKLTIQKIKNMQQNLLPLQKAKMEILGEKMVGSTKQYYGALMEFFGRKNQLTKEDVGRCIGVDVDYVATMDFDMEPADMEFIMKQGVAAATAFLCEHTEKQHEKPAAGPPITFVAEC